MCDSYFALVSLKKNNAAYILNVANVFILNISNIFLVNFPVKMPAHGVFEEVTLASTESSCANGTKAEVQVYYCCYDICLAL